MWHLAPGLCPHQPCRGKRRIAQVWCRCPHPMAHPGLPAVLLNPRHAVQQTLTRAVIRTPWTASCSGLPWVSVWGRRDFEDGGIGTGDAEDERGQSGAGAHDTEAPPVFSSTATGSPRLP